MSKVLDAKGRCEWEESELECWGLLGYLTNLSITVLRLRRVEERSEIIKLRSEPYMHDYLLLHFQTSKPLFNG